MGWTGGFVLLTTLMVPYLRKFGKATVPDFIGDRFYSNGARLVAVICAIFICMTHIMGQMRGVGIVFSRLFDIEIWMGVLIGGGIVFFYAGLGGMKGITYTQVAQYCVMVFSYTIPVIFISIIITGNVIPQLGLIENYIKDGAENSVPLIVKNQPDINRPWLPGIHRKYQQYLGYVLYHCCSDDWYRGSTPCDCAFLYRKKCESGSKISLLDALFHRYHLPDRTGSGNVCPHQFCGGDKPEKICRGSRSGLKTGRTRA